MGSPLTSPLVALGIELPPVLGDEPDADEIDRERPRDELGVEPVFHGRRREAGTFPELQSSRGNDNFQTLIRPSFARPTPWVRLLNNF